MIGNVLLHDYPTIHSEIDGYMETFKDQLFMAAILMGINPGDLSHLRRFRHYEEKIITVTKTIKRKHPDVFESMRIAIGEAHQHQGWILLAMKEAVRVRLTDAGRAKQIQEEILAGFAKIKELDLSDDQAWLFQAQVGQEVGEMIFHNDVFFETMFRGTPPPLPTLPQELGEITPQAWLASMCDVPGELSKTLLYFTSTRMLPPEHELELRLRFVAIARTLVDFLNQYVSRYGLVIDNSRQRHWASRFRAMVTRAESNIPHELEKIQKLKKEVGL